MRRLIKVVFSLSIVLVAAGALAAQGVRLRPLGPIYVDAEGSPIRLPEGVGCGATQTLLVADTGNGRLLRFEMTEDGIDPVGAITLPQIPRPIHAEIASNGEIFALDGKRRRIVRLDASGQFRDELEPAGLDAPMSPKSFTLDGRDQLWIIDLYSESILVVDAAGELKRRIAFPEDHGFVSDLTVTSGGQVFAVDGVRKTILTARSADTTLSAVKDGLVGKAEFPASIAADAAGNLYVADLNGGSILVLGFDGSFRARQSGLGWKPGLLRYPSKLCVHESDRIVVADRANSRIQVFEIVR